MADASRMVPADQQRILAKQQRRDGFVDVRLRSPGTMEGLAETDTAPSSAWTRVHGRSGNSTMCTVSSAVTFMSRSSAGYRLTPIRVTAPVAGRHWPG